MQGQWPAPLYPMLVIAAAAAAERRAGLAGGLRAAAAPVGFAVYAASLAFMLAPVRRAPAVPRPGGEPARLAGVLRARSRRRARSAGAAWVGAPTYGIAAQLAAAPRIHAPATEIFERERFTFETPAERADFSKPGLVVIPVRGAGVGALHGCFADVQLLPEIDRGAGRGMTAYTVLRVAGPSRDIERIGCWRPPQARF